MNDRPDHETPELLACEVCLAQIPADEAVSAEGDEYVWHFCGVDCYRLWKEKTETSGVAE